MDRKEFDERALRLQDVAKVIGALPTEIRSKAFSLLKGYVSGRTALPQTDEGKHNENEPGDNLGDADTSIFSRFDHDKPSDNVRLIAAYLFQQYGAEPFSLEDMKAIAAETGITIPARVDMTLRQAKEKGKHLFVDAGAGKFKPTVHGETYLKEKYGVKKGNQKREEAS